MGVWSHKSKFWKSVWGHGTLPAVIGFCRWQVKALLRSYLLIHEGHLSIPNMATPGLTWLRCSCLRKLLKIGETLGETTRLVHIRFKIMAGLIQYWVWGWSWKTFLSVEGNKILTFWDSQVWQKRSCTWKLNLKIEAKCIFLKRSKYTLEQFTEHCCGFL